MARGAHYTLVLDDGGREASKRCGQHSDCTVRALAIVTATPYDEVYETLARAGRRSCAGFESDEWLKRRRGRAFGGRFRALNVTDLTPSTFATRYPTGRFLLETSSHTWACISSIHHDLWRVKEQPLSGAWLFTPDRA